MPPCRRDTDDPLLRQLFAVHKLHLVTPEVGYEVGEVAIEKPGGDVWRASLGDLFENAPATLVAARDRPAGEVADKVSGKFQASSAVGFLHGIAAAFGVEGSAKLAAAYGSAKTLSVRVRAVTKDLIDLGAAARFLADAALRANQGLYRDGDRIYLIREVLRARGIEVAAHDRRDQALNVSAESTGLAQAHLALAARNDYASTVVYEGKTSAAFALRLVEIAPETPGWGILEVRKPVHVRGDGADDFDAPDAIVGDPAAGPLFIDWAAGPTRP